VSCPQDATARYVRARVGSSKLRRLHPRSLSLHSWGRLSAPSGCGFPNHLGVRRYSLAGGLATTQKPCRAEPCASTEPRRKKFVISASYAEVRRCTAVFAGAIDERFRRVPSGASIRPVQPDLDLRNLALAAARRADAIGRDAVGHERVAHRVGTRPCERRVAG